MKKLILPLILLTISCSKDEYPKSVYINAVTIENIPTTNTDGEPWDLDSNPDIIFLIKFPTHDWRGSEHIDFDISQPYKSSINSTVQFGEAFKFSLLDLDDDDENDRILKDSITIDTLWNKTGLTTINSGATLLTFEYEPNF